MDPFVCHQGKRIGTNREVGDKRFLTASATENDLLTNLICSLPQLKFFPPDSLKLIHQSVQLEVQSVSVAKIFFWASVYFGLAA